MASSKLISLKTSDGVVFEVEPTLAKSMKTVQSIIDEAAVDVSVIPLHDVFSNHLTKIIEYHRLSEAGKVNEFSVEELSNYEVRDFYVAVYNLKIEGLFEFLAKALAARIENKSVEYVRKLFGMVNDYTPEEKAVIR